MQTIGSSLIMSVRENIKVLELKKTDDVVLLSIATFTLFPIYIILQNSTLI